jgi:hypothetical protein
MPMSLLPAALVALAQYGPFEGRSCPMGEDLSWMNVWNSKGVNYDFGYKDAVAPHNFGSAQRMENLNDHEITVCVMMVPQGKVWPRWALEQRQCIILAPHSLRCWDAPYFMWNATHFDSGLSVTRGAVCRWGIDTMTFECTKNAEAEAAEESARGLRLDKMAKLFIEARPKAPVPPDIAKLKKACLAGDAKACAALKH